MRIAVQVELVRAWFRGYQSLLQILGWKYVVVFWLWHRIGMW